MYEGKIKLSNSGYNEATINNYSVREILDNHDDLIETVRLELLLFADGYAEAKNANDKSYDPWNKYNINIKMEELVLKGSKIVTSRIDSKVLKNRDIEMNRYVEGVHKYRAELFFESIKLFDDTQLSTNEKRLMEKYNEDFIFYGVYFSKVINDDFIVFTPKRDGTIIFEAGGGKDKYASALYQDIVSKHIEGVLEKRNAKDSIGYFVSCLGSSKYISKSPVELRGDLSMLKDPSLSFDISLYYLKEKGREIDDNDRSLLMHVNNDIHEAFHKDATSFVYTFIYSMDEFDRKVALKLLDEYKLSEIYLRRERGMDTWAEYADRVRNHSDAFKYLDVFGEKEEGVYATCSVLTNLRLPIEFEKMKQDSVSN